MATIFSHAVFAMALGAGFTAAPALAGKAPWKMPARFWALTALCAMIPDADVISFTFGVPYRHVLGHRGISHSIAFALLTALLVTLICFREREAQCPRVALAGFFFLATISHSFLDAMTNGGPGPAVLAPLDNTRYFLPWRPIEVSPIGADFFSARGLTVFISELKWIWFPSLLLVFLSFAGRKLFRLNLDRQH
ncbi:MAG: metal-dependent hydrolase [Blastocatellia bacterium]